MQQSLNWGSFDEDIAIWDVRECPWLAQRCHEYRHVQVNGRVLRGPRDLEKHANGSMAYDETQPLANYASKVDRIYAIPMRIYHVQIARKHSW